MSATPIDTPATPQAEGHELVEHWRAVFRHSAGRLGSQWLTALHEQREILGWRTGTPPRVVVPPKDFGTKGEFIEVGPGARLLAFAPADWVAEPGGPGVLGLVMLDGADTPLYARVLGASPKTGMRLTACIAETPAGTGADLWFEAA